MKPRSSKEKKTAQKSAQTSAPTTPHAIAAPTYSSTLRTRAAYLRTSGLTHQYAKFLE